MPRLPCDMCLLLGDRAPIAVDPVYGCRHNRVSDAIEAHRQGEITSAEAEAECEAAYQVFLGEQTVEFMARTIDS